MQAGVVSRVSSPSLLYGAALSSMSPRCQKAIQTDAPLHPDLRAAPNCGMGRRMSDGHRHQVQGKRYGQARIHPHGCNCNQATGGVHPPAPRGVLLDGYTVSAETVYIEERCQVRQGCGAGVANTLDLVLGLVFPARRCQTRHHLQRCFDQEPGKGMVSLQQDKEGLKEAKVNKPELGPGRLWSGGVAPRWRWCSECMLCIVRYLHLRMTHERGGGSD